MKTNTLNLLAGLALATTSFSAFATPTLGDITGIPGTDVYSDTGAEFVNLSDTDGTNDDATAFLLFELADLAPTNAFGIYGFDNSVDPVTLGNTLEVFDGAAAPISSVTLAFDLIAGTVTRSDNGDTAMIGASFGFYLEDTANGNTFYSHTDLNSDGFDHALLFDTSDNAVGGLLGSDVVVAFEDIISGGDQDFNDLVIGVSDVTLPEPTGLALVGAGLLVAGLGRRAARRA